MPSHQQALAQLGLKDIHLAVLGAHDNGEGRNRFSHVLDKKNIDAQNSQGATPLMLAALTGNKAIVSLLVGKASQFQKDVKGRTAIDYASERKFVKRKVILYRRLGFPSACRSSKELRKSRKHILTILQGNIPIVHFLYAGSQFTLLQPFGGKFYNTGLSMEKRTTGFISSSERIPFPEMTAISGWKAHSGTGRILDNPRYTQLVRDFSKSIGFLLPSSRNDNGGKCPLPEHRGREAACHAEKKLAIWWMEEQLRYAFGSDDFSAIRELKHFPLPAERRRCWLFLSHDHLCRNCLRFLATIHQLSGLEVIPVPCPMVQYSTRSPRLGGKNKQKPQRFPVPPNKTDEDDKARHGKAAVYNDQGDRVESGQNTDGENSGPAIAAIQPDQPREQSSTISRNASATVIPDDNVHSALSRRGPITIRSTPESEMPPLSSIQHISPIERSPEPHRYKEPPPPEWLGTKPLPASQIIKYPLMEPINWRSSLAYRASGLLPQDHPIPSVEVDAESLPLVARSVNTPRADLTQSVASTTLDPVSFQGGRSAYFETPSSGLPGIKDRLTQPAQRTLDLGRFVYSQYGNRSGPVPRTSSQRRNDGLPRRFSQSTFLGAVRRNQLGRGRQGE